MSAHAETSVYSIFGDQAIPIELTGLINQTLYAYRDFPETGEAPCAELDMLFAAGAICNFDRTGRIGEGVYEVLHSIGNLATARKNDGTDYTEGIVLFTLGPEALALRLKESLEADDLIARSINHPEVMLGILERRKQERNNRVFSSKRRAA